MHGTVPHRTVPAQPVVSSSIWSAQWYLVKGTDYEASHSASFFHRLPTCWSLFRAMAHQARLLSGGRNMGKWRDSEQVFRFSEYYNQGVPSV
jgi:hypothetical protein